MAYGTNALVQRDVEHPVLGVMTEALLNHVLTTKYSELSSSAVLAAKTFLFDTLVVAVAGSSHPCTDRVRRAAVGWGDGKHCRVWATGEPAPAATAAFLNAYQVHNQEFDSLHESAVVHAPATIVPVILAWAEARGGVSGRDFITAFCVGVDVAATIGMAQGAPMRFFRPAMCGALGAVAALTNIGRLSRRAAESALGLTYSQLSGTMQAHTEGSPALALQIGCNARAAICAYDLVEGGFQGPRDFLEGPFGYFSLYDGARKSDVLGAQLGEQWEITRLSHKPFPTGRAAHGAIQGTLALAATRQFEISDIAAVEVSAPPLVQHLAGRYAKPGMDPSYARLCIPYLVATAFLRGEVSLDDFFVNAMSDQPRLKLAELVRVVRNDVVDPNSLAPQSVSVKLRSGEVQRVELPVMLGHPEHPLSQKMQLQKARSCFRASSVRFPESRAEQLWETVFGMETMNDVRQLVNLIVSSGST